MTGSHRPLLNPVGSQCCAAHARPFPSTRGWPSSRRPRLRSSFHGRRHVSSASALDKNTNAATAPVQPSLTAAQLCKATAVLQNAITTAVVDFSRRDEPQAAAGTQFVIVTEQMPLDRAAAEGWLDKLVCQTTSSALPWHCHSAANQNAGQLILGCPALDGARDCCHGHSGCAHDMR